MPKRSALDRLHPVVVHHIVNTLGLRSQRALQDQAAGPVLDGADALLLAPTAGGKTEAARVGAAAEPAEPPDVLLTTPESLEAMLISLKVEHGRLFTDLRAIVVDEVHAFAGDDRGWNLRPAAGSAGVMSIWLTLEWVRGMRLCREHLARPPASRR